MGAVLTAIQMFFGIGNATAGADGIVYQTERPVPGWLIILGVLAVVAVLYFVFKAKKK